MKTKSHQFTKDEIRKVMSLWDGNTLNQIAEELDINASQVQYLSNQMRKCGIELPKKHRIGILRNLINEVMKEQ